MSSRRPSGSARQGFIPTLAFQDGTLELEHATIEAVLAQIQERR